MGVKQFLDQTLTYTLIYKKRKSLGIYIDPYGHVEVRVPKETTFEQIEKLLESKWAWIIEKQAEMKEKTKGFKEKTYTSGELFLFQGKSYPIKIISNHVETKEGVFFTGDCLEVYLSAPELEAQDNHDLIKKAMKRFYYQQCKALVESRIKHYQPFFKTKPRSIKISDNKKTWGTCNNHYELTFNWKLAMAPIEIIDYIVVHEMSHMVHLNHDRSFWRLVGKLMPDYEKCQQWLADSHWKMTV